MKAYAEPLCTGDCNADGAVTIDELLVGVNMALADESAASCAAFDANGDGQVSVDELVDATLKALAGC